MTQQHGADALVQMLGVGAHRLDFGDLRRERAQRPAAHQLLPIPDRKKDMSGRFSPGESEGVDAARRRCGVHAGQMQAQEVKLFGHYLARSISAEGLLNHLGKGRFKAYSAGSHPTGQVNPFALRALQQFGIETNDFRSKNWDEFSQDGAPELDFAAPRLRQGGRRGLSGVAWPADDRALGRA